MQGSKPCALPLGDTPINSAVAKTKIMSGKRKQNLVPFNLATFRQPKSMLSLKPKSCLERENKTLCLLTLPLVASEKPAVA